VYGGPAAVPDLEEVQRGWLTVPDAMTELAARVRVWSPRPGAFLLVLAVAAGALLGFRALSFRGEALPGAELAGVELAGLSRSEAEAKIQRLVGSQLAAPVTVRARGRTVGVSPREIFALDLVRTTERVYDASAARHAVAVVSPVEVRRDVRPVLVVREDAAQELVRRLNRLRRPARSATVTMRGIEPVVTPARFGTKLDRVAFLAALRRAAFEPSARTITARYRVAVPTHKTPAATEAAALARAVVAAPVTLTWDGSPVRTLTQPQLARVLRFDPQGSRYVVMLDGRALARLVDPALAGRKQRAVNARLVVEGERVRVAPGAPGIGLDLERVLGEVTAAAYSPDVRVAELRLRSVPPDVTTAELAALGIRRRVSSFTTDMGPSSANRIWNVQLMARYVDGTVIRPGEAFSFNRVVGERTTERGFREGQMILGSLLLPSIGGGVCQTATTLFNNAFELGLPVLRRYNHNFYIDHYPLGRDATVSWGGPDLVFRNDLDNALLIKSSYTTDTLTFTFYGTPQNRRVVSATGPKENWRSPQTTYALDPYAPAGSVRHVSGANAMGFDVTVYRRVYEEGKLLRKDAFESSYVPTGPTVIYGPGAGAPRVDFVLPPPESY
jgi:vancomycin resistance protein YoaR